MAKDVVGLPTKGSQLFYRYDGKVKMLNCPEALEGLLGNEKEDIDVTTLCDENENTISGVGSAVDVTGDIYYDDKEDTHDDMIQLLKSGERVEWCFALPQPNTAVKDQSVPTWDDDEWDLPDDRTFITFAGYVRGFPIAAPNKGAFTASLTIRVGGGFEVSRREVSDD